MPVRQQMNSNPGEGQSVDVPVSRNPPCAQHQGRAEAGIAYRHLAYANRPDPFSFRTQFASVSVASDQLVSTASKQPKVTNPSLHEAQHVEQQCPVDKTLQG